MQPQLRFPPLAWELSNATGTALKRKEKKNIPPKIDFWEKSEDLESWIYIPGLPVTKTLLEVIKIVASVRSC